MPSTAWSVTLPGWLAVGEGVPEETGFAFPSLPSLQFDADGSPLVAFRASNARSSETRYGLFTRRRGQWRAASDYQPPKDARPGVCFRGPIRPHPEDT